jgi:SNF2 family DNA or RNA helicase
MISVTIEDNMVRITAPSRLADIISRIPNLRAVRGSDAWEGPICPALMFAIAADLSKLQGFTPSAEVVEVMKTYQALRTLVVDRKVGFDDAEYDDRLFHYQRAGVWMLMQGGCLLGDEMGTGKTVMALTAARQLWLGGHTANILVVCPNSMKHRWIEEAETWFPEADGFVVGGTKAQKTKTIEAAGLASGVGPVVVATNWESLRTLSRVAGYGSQKLTEADAQEGPLNTELGWDVVIADEAHRAKDPNSKQTRALWALGKGAEYRWALTGTPVLNTPGDLWAIGRFYDPESYGGGRQKWHNRFVAFIETNWGPKDIGMNRSRESEFQAWFDMRFIRRTKDEVLDLPPVTYQTRTIEMHSKQRSAYNRMVKDMIVAIDDGILVATDPLALLTRLSQIASATPVVEDGEVIALDTPSNKVTAVLEILDELEEDKQLVVFAASRKLIELCASELDRKGTSNVSVTGAVDPALRAANVQRFQEGQVRVALVTLGAGSEGINLYAADTAVFMQRSYSFGQSLQAEARIHRIGQEADHVTIIDLVSEETVDEVVLDVLRSKGEMSEEVLRDRAREILGSKA